MGWIQALVLGILQGLTEFLPISSSGHLVIGQELMDITISGYEFEVMVHMGTLFSVLVIFRWDIFKLFTTLDKNETRQDILSLIAGTIPAIIAGVLFKDEINKLFDNVGYVGIALICTGVVLLISKVFKGNRSSVPISIGFAIGLFQSLAIIPGLSRSGLTISGALALGILPEKAARFSFLLSIPIILGAGILTAYEIESYGKLSMAVMVAGFFSSFIVGLFALKWLLRWLKSGRFFWFGFYCLFIGILTLFFS